jgi:hypothetical protein
MVGYINALNTPTMSFSDKLFYFTPFNLYNSLDTYFREVIFTLANDYQFGMPLSVIVTTLVVRLLF